MRVHCLLAVVVPLGLLGAAVPAEEAEPALGMPAGARVRLRTHASDAWIEGTLASADRRSISLVPEVAPALGDNRLRLPSENVTRLEILTGKRSRWLAGLVVGAAAGVAMGFDVGVDPVQCELDDEYFCSRGAAVVAMGATSAMIGALVGNLVKTDVWTPVPLDAVGPSRTPSAQARLGFRPTRGGVAARLSVGF